MIPMTKSRAEELLVPLKNGEARGISGAWKERLIEALEYIIADTCRCSQNGEHAWKQNKNYVQDRTCVYCGEHR